MKGKGFLHREDELTYGDVFTRRTKYRYGTRGMQKKMRVRTSRVYHLVLYHGASADAKTYKQENCQKSLG